MGPQNLETKKPVNAITPQSWAHDLKLEDAPPLKPIRDKNGHSFARELSEVEAETRAAQERMTDLLQALEQAEPVIEHLKK